MCNNNCIQCLIPWIFHSLSTLKQGSPELILCRGPKCPELALGGALGNLFFKECKNVYSYMIEMVAFNPLRN